MSRKTQVLIHQILSVHRVLWLKLRGFTVSFGLLIGSGVRFTGNSILSIMLGRRVQICSNSSIHSADGGQITIGDNTGIGRYCSICSYRTIILGSDCLVSDWVHISDCAHITGNGAKPISSGLKAKAGVKIGNRCFIGRNSTILPGVTLGDECVVGAGAVVTKSFPKGSVIAGVPAKLIRATA